MSEPLKAFSHGITKARFLEELNKHAEADSFVQGIFYDEDTFKGCAVGCSVKSINEITGSTYYAGSYAAYEVIGIPTWLAYFEDNIFESLSIKEAKEWPLLFTEAINEGADLSTIKEDYFNDINSIAPFPINDMFMESELNRKYPTIFIIANLKFNTELMEKAADMLLDRIRKCKPAEQGGIECLPN